MDGSAARALAAAQQHGVYAAALRNIKEEAGMHVMRDCHELWHMLRCAAILLGLGEQAARDGIVERICAVRSGGHGTGLHSWCARGGCHDLQLEDAKMCVKQ